MLREYHGVLGELIPTYQGTLEHFAGDGSWSSSTTLSPSTSTNCRPSAWRSLLRPDSPCWRTRGEAGNRPVARNRIEAGYATLGRIGFEGRFDYGALGPVVNLASRLSAMRPRGRSSSVSVSSPRRSTPSRPRQVGAFDLKGFARPVVAYEVRGSEPLARPPSEADLPLEPREHRRRSERRQEPQDERAAEVDDQDGRDERDIRTSCPATCTWSHPRGRRLAAAYAASASAYVATAMIASHQRRDQSRTASVTAETEIASTTQWYTSPTRVEAPPLADAECHQPKQERPRSGDDVDDEDEIRRRASAPDSDVAEERGPLDRCLPHRRRQWTTLCFVATPASAASIACWPMFTRRLPGRSIDRVPQGPGAHGTRQLGGSVRLSAPKRADGVAREVLLISAFWRGTKRDGAP